MRAWLAARAIPGVEHVSDDGYARTARIDNACLVVHVRHRPHATSFEMTVHASGTVDVREVSARVCRVLGIDRDVSAAAAHLAQDPRLASALARHPGLHVPGGWDPFELAVRVVLGQQVTIAAARRLASDLVGACGTPLPAQLCEPGLTRIFPRPHEMASADLSLLRMPAARRATLRALADAAVADPGLLQPEASLDTAIARLRAVKGIGDWTAHYIALRALRHPDAFPSSDAGLLRGAARVLGARPSPAGLLARAEAWRPHRAYAAQLLWAEDGAS